jgi:phage gp45-like
MGPPGDDSVPNNGDRVIVVDLTPAYRVAVATEDSTIPESGKGEKELYSYNALGLKLARMKLADDSSIEIKNDLATVKIESTGAITLDGPLASVNMAVDGTIELNGNSDFAVSFTDLKTAFDQLKNDFNTFVNTKYNVHVHPGVTAGPASTAVTLTLGAPSAADMSAAKVESVKVP